MKKIIVNENQRGLLFNNGKFIKMLNPGKYHTYGNKEIEIVSLDSPLTSTKCSIEILLNNDEIKKSVSVIEVADEQLALHFIGGKFIDALAYGKYAFWKINKEHSFKIVDISTPIVNSDIPKYIFEKMQPIFYNKVEVPYYKKAKIFFDKKLEKIVDAGTYYFWRTSSKVDIEYVDTRLIQINIVGQEILTADKVMLRINIICKYKIKDYIKIMSEVDNYEEQLYVMAQIALRNYVGGQKLDDILANKEEISNYIFNYLKDREEELYIEVKETGVKDIILPGEIRNIMNTVLIAEKKAQASVISRREEVASTRSLLNTAKLMDENKTLYKLKELEYIEKICSNVGNINVSGNSDLITQLTSILTEKK